MDINILKELLIMIGVITVIYVIAIYLTHKHLPKTLNTCKKW